MSTGRGKIKKLTVRSGWGQEGRFLQKRKQYPQKMAGKTRKSGGKSAVFVMEEGDDGSKQHDFKVF